MILMIILSNAMDQSQMELSSIAKFVILIGLVQKFYISIYIVNIKVVSQSVIYVVLCSHQNIILKDTKMLNISKSKISSVIGVKKFSQKKRN